MMAVQPHVVIGLGESGRSVARRLAAEDIPFSVGEDHPAASAMHEMAQLPNPPSIVPISELIMNPGSKWIVSPGVPLSLPKLRAAIPPGFGTNGQTSCVPQSQLAQVGHGCELLPGAFR